MPFEELVQVIETLRGRIREHRQVLESNETRTRMALIDPLLRALGWDTENPAQVLPEYESGSGKPGERADYALMGEGKPKAVIEAKKLRESLANHRGQMVNYANMAGIPYAGLTDGDTWEFYDVFDRKPLDERRLLHVSISDGEAHECALKLLLLWRPNMASGQPLQPSAPVLVEPPEREPPQAPEPSPEPIAPPLLPTAGWVALSELDVPAGAPPPISVRFADGKEASTAKWWRSLLVETGLWLDGEGLLRKGGVPMSSGPKRYLLHTTPEHPRGNAFRNPVRLPQSEIYLETHASAKQLVSHAIKVLKAFGQDPARVYVRTRT